MKKSERKRKKLEEKSLKLETELTEARCHAQETTHHNQELENFSRNRNAEILKKDEMINKLQDALQASKGAHEWLEDEKRRLERLLEERQWELRQRATQLSELGGQLQEFRNTTEKRNAELENELQCSQCQLKERNQQVKELDERYSVAREETRELLRRQEEWEQSVRRSEKEQEQKEKRIRELEKSVDEERRAREERHQTCLGTTQQLRVAREREQNMARQIQDCDREIGRLNREMEQLMVEVEELGSENKEKDERLQRVVKQIGEISTEKLAIETRYRDEMDRIEKDVDKIREQHREKVENLESEISNLRVRASVANGNQEQAISSATQLEQLMRDENHRTKQTMEALERELVARKQVIESANDAIIMKDAEIARLQAKYSGLERGVAMSSLPNTPVKLQCQENISQDPAHTPTFLRESPWTHKDDNTTNSLFNGFESEIGSLAPSFVPIAASTKRLPATNQSEVDSSSFFVTSSPTPDNNADVIMSDFSLEDDSLYKRVFADTVHASPSSRESRKVNKVLHFDQSDVTLRPEKCMADLQEKLRASEQRRRDVTSKLRHLKSASSNT